MGCSRRCVVWGVWAPFFCCQVWGVGLLWGVRWWGGVMVAAGRGRLGRRKKIMGLWVESWMGVCRSSSVLRSRMAWWWWGARAAEAVK